MTTVGDVTKWAGLVTGIILTSLLALLGTVESAHWRIIGFLTEADFTDVISPWRIPSEALDAAAAAGSDPPTARVPTPAERSQAGLVGRACRILAGKQKSAKEEHELEKHQMELEKDIRRTMASQSSASVSASPTGKRAKYSCIDQGQEGDEEPFDKAKIE